MNSVLRRLGVPYAGRLTHVPFGHVMGMQTRAQGRFVEVNDFLDEARSRALDAYREQNSKRPLGSNEDEISEAVALSAAVFSTLKTTRLKEVAFDWDRALAFHGDSGAYLLYAYARINGIRRKAAEAGISLRPAAHLELLNEECAFKLAELLDDFGDRLDRVVAENEPAYLASYGLDVAYAISKAYPELQVLGEAPELAEGRLALFEATRVVLGLCIRLLGMKPVQCM
jgi:arginyl-tRNA synthetase